MNSNKREKTNNDSLVKNRTIPFKENQQLQQMLVEYKQSDMRKFTTFSEYVKLHIQIKQSEEVDEMSTQMRIDQSLIEHFEFDSFDDDYLD